MMASTAHSKSLFEHTSVIISLLLSHGGPHIQSSVECMLPNPIVCPRVKPRGPPVIAKTHRDKPHLHRLSGCITTVPSATRSENKACAHFTRWRVIQNDGSCFTDERCNPLSLRSSQSRVAFLLVV